MTDELESKLNELGTEIDALPREKKRAVVWVIENFDLAVEMCGNSSFSDEEIQRRKEEAAEKEDHLGRALLCLCQALRKEGERERRTGKSAEEAPKERV
ncbi:hypothetical protein [Allofournierella sp.]|uniref:hypothetical protein n=1 Tax=Allofournierella sp. TaxID=1940256 RepID=UPI003AB8971D